MERSGNSSMATIPLARPEKFRLGMSWPDWSRLNTSGKNAYRESALTTGSPVSRMNSGISRSDNFQNGGM